MQEMLNIPQTIFSQWRVFFLFLVTLLATYWVVVVTPYAFIDEYVFVREAQGGEFLADLMRRGTAMGRPMGALISVPLMFSVHDIGDLRYVRLMTVVVIALLAWFLHRALVAAGWPEQQAALLAFIICVMPGFEVAASWVFGNCIIPFAAIFAGGAAWSATMAFDEPPSRRKWALVAGAVFLFWAAIATYQPPAMFFWVFTAIRLFTPQATPGSTLRGLLRYGVIAVIALTLGFGTWKVGSTLYLPLSPDRANLTQDIPAKLILLKSAVTGGLNFAHIPPSPQVAYVAAVFVMVGLLLYFNGDVKRRIGMVLMALALIPLTYLPNLATAENWPAYRSQSALGPLIVVYAFLALQGYRRAIFNRLFTRDVLTGVLVVAALSSGLMASYNVTVCFALPQFLELKVMQSQLTRQDLSQVNSIYVIRSHWSHTVAPAATFDEFGLPSSYPHWTPQPMVYLLLHQIDPARAEMPVEVAPAGGPIAPPPGALIVDMRQLQYFHW
jgi:hypothetical protein